MHLKKIYIYVSYRYYRSIVVRISPLTSWLEFVGEAEIDARVKEKVCASEVELVYITPECIIETSTS